jgi:hypothetical protein
MTPACIQTAMETKRQGLLSMTVVKRAKTRLKSWRF